MSRAVYVYRPGHPKADQFNMVDTSDLNEEPTPLALNAPIMAGRFYEGAHVERMEPDEKKGSAKVVTYDLGTRKRHREYLKRFDLATADDFNGKGGYWERAAADRQRVTEGTNDRKERRESIARAMYEVEQKQRRR
jgi:hypothetical protein